MDLKYRIKGLAETTIEGDDCTCKFCKSAVKREDDIEIMFIAEVISTLEGIVAYLRCKNCGYQFVPPQYIEVLDPIAWQLSVKKCPYRGWAKDVPYDIVTTIEEAVSIFDKNERLH